MKKILCICSLICAVLFANIYFTHATSNISSENFQISVGTISPWGDTHVQWGTEASVNSFLSTVIDKLIVAFGALSLLFMTIGAGYMIVYHGQDELLSRWKSIFVAGLISLAVALMAGMLVRFVAYLLYQ